MDKQKKYLDKVINHIVKNTKMDYEKKTIYFLNSFYPPLVSSPRKFTNFSSHPHFISRFSKHCIDTFGLTGEEIEYVWNEYKDIIKNKIENGQTKKIFR